VERTKVARTSSRDPRGWRILLNDYCGHPFQAQLSRELARRGATVLHTYCDSYVTGRGDLQRRPDDPVEVDFRPLGFGRTFEKHSIIRRFRQERQYGQLLVEVAREFSPDVIISANTPLFAQAQVIDYARRNRRRFVFWLQDVISVAMSAELRRRLGVLGLAPARYVQSLEGRLLRSSDAIVAITDDFIAPLSAWSVPRSKVSVIENWAPLEEIPPLPKRNPWALQHGFADRFIYLYAGTLGLKHDPELLVELARAIKDRTDALVVVVSEGMGADHCRRRALEQGLRNLVVLPFQPYEALPEMLASADVLTVVLEAEAGSFSVPSKVLSYHCAGRPILAAVPPENLAARILERNASGLVAAPGRYVEFTSAALRLMDDTRLRATLGANARRYAEERFAIGSIADRFLDVIGPQLASRSSKQEEYGYAS
jgi:colanic acid biosynthesis glycosyl transferase WcaI